MKIGLSYETFAVRDDLAEAHRRAWRRLARPGTWWDGRRRIDIASETRAARECQLCRKRLAALSPHAVQGTHDGHGALPDALTEVIHRIATDQSRLTRRFYTDAIDAGLADTEYVETLGVVATVIAIDSFCDALGIAHHPLPNPEPGEPSRRRPTGATTDLAWMPTVAPEAVTEAEAGLYDGLKGVHIHQALSLVPEEVIGFFDLDAAQYLPDAALRDFGHEYRDLSHTQIEVLAARVSAINQCVY